MQVLLESEEDRNGMRAAGAFNARLMDQVRLMVQPGVTTREIDQFVYAFTTDYGHIPATLGYHGSIRRFPKSCCTSVNDVVCHGIPDGYLLKDGDIVNVDLTSIVNGWHADSSETFLVGECDDQTRGLVQTTLECLYLGIEAAAPFKPINDIAKAITAHAEGNGFSVVRVFQGHGIGRQFHMPPGIPHYPWMTSSQSVLVPGMCFTIEPMINAGTHECDIDVFGDGWTAKTRDGKRSAQFEHTLLMTADGPEILTLTKHGPRP
jgi:methionyl aminopeptidase